VPFKSKRQARWMWATHPAMAERWAAHTKDVKALPESADPEKKGFTPMGAFPSNLAAAAADTQAVEKLAAHSAITPTLVRHLAGLVSMTPAAFVKAAYADPAGYVTFLEIASGAKPAGLTKTAMPAIVSKLLGVMAKGGKAVAGAGKAAVGKAEGAGSYFQSSAPSAAGGLGGKIDRVLARGPLGGSQAGRHLQAGGAAAGVGGGGAMALGGGKPQPGAPAAAGPHEAAVNDQVGAAAQQPIAAPPKPQPQPQPQPGLGSGPGAGPQPQQPPAQGGMGAAGKALLAAGGVGLGALGVGALARRRKQKQVQAGDALGLAKAAMRRAVVKKAAALYRTAAVVKLTGYLDKVAGLMSPEKSAAVRTVQAAVLGGKSLAEAIKVAYPVLPPEGRGVLAAKLVAGAVKAAAFAGKVVTRREAEVKAKDGAAGKTFKAMSACG